MRWLHTVLMLASGIEACSGTGTYLLSMAECAACLSHFLFAAELPVE